LLSSRYYTPIYGFLAPRTFFSERDRLGLGILAHDAARRDISGRGEAPLSARYRGAQTPIFAWKDRSARSTPEARHIGSDSDRQGRAPRTALAGRHRGVNHP